MSDEEVGAREKRALSPTHDLAYFYWHEILGNEEDPWSDINFKRRVLSNSKRVLKQGADLDTIKLALTMMRDDGEIPYSPQQAVDWTRRKSGGKSYYQCAEDEMHRLSKQPPVYDAIAYAEWKVKNADKLQGTAEDSNLQPDS
jgi:hypothetical protein